MNSLSRDKKYNSKIHSPFGRPSHLRQGLKGHRWHKWWDETSDSSDSVLTGTGLTTYILSTKGHKNPTFWSETKPDMSLFVRRKGL